MFVYVKIVMTEKTLSGYQTFPDAIYWEDDTGEFHKKYGPAIMYASGQWHWYKNGEFIEGINIEDDDVQIKSIIKEIDFKKIHSVMKLLDWRWGYNQTVPTVKELKFEANRILNGLKKHRTKAEPYYSQCGGFKGYASKAGFKLEFVLESWDTELN